MAKRAVSLEIRPDYGVAYRQPHLYVVGERADPDDPNRTVRGARREMAFVAWWRAGRISDAEREAAERYGRLAEEATGARWRPDSVGGGTPYRCKTPAEWQIDAAQDLRLVERAAGDLAPVLIAVAMGSTLEQLARSRRIRESRALGVARDALWRACDHWRINC